MRCMRYQFSISHVAGKDLIVADALSRAPVCLGTHKDGLFQQEVQAYVQQVMASLPATDVQLSQIREL